MARANTNSSNNLVWGIVIGLVIVIAIMTFSFSNKIRRCEDLVENLSVNNYEIVKEVNNVIEEINNYTVNIEYAMDWFKENSFYANPNINKCNVDCTINLGCVTDTMYAEGYKYIEEDEDKLRGLDYFIGNKGGDCEDWSLFYKAEVNYLIDQCEDYMIEDREGKYISPVRPVVYCHGDHCEVAFGMDVVEPQTGVYTGNVGAGALLMISDNDLLIYDEATEEWIGYEYFGERLTENLRLLEKRSQTQ